MSYCPWNGVENCGCGAFPFTWNGMMPKRCEELMPFAMMNAHLKYLSPEKIKQYEAWAKMPAPPEVAAEITRDPDAPRPPKQELLTPEQQLHQPVLGRLRGMQQLNAAKLAARIMAKKETAG